LIDSRADERDQPFLLGATNLKIPSYKACYLALMRRFNEQGVKELNGHLLYSLADGEYAAAGAWLERQGILDLVAEAAAARREGGEQSIDALFDTDYRWLKYPVVHGSSRLPITLDICFRRIARANNHYGRCDASAITHR
jgi:hypothetical protein